MYLYHLAIDMHNPLAITEILVLTYSLLHTFSVRPHCEQLHPRWYFRVHQLIIDQSCVLLSVSKYNKPLRLCIIIKPLQRFRAGACSFKYSPNSAHVSQCSAHRDHEAIMTYHERTSRNIEFAYKNGNDYSIQLARWFLIPIGAWPLTNVSMIERISLQMQILIGFLMLGTVVIPCSLYVLLEAEDTQIKISTVGPLSHWFLGVINYWLLLMRTDDIRKCVLHMETDWQLVRKIDEQDTMLRYAKIGRFVSVFCALFLQSGALLFIVAKAMGNTTVTIGNDTVSIYALGCPIYCEFVDTRFSPANEIMLVIEFITCFMVNSVTVGTCSLATIFAMHACGQLSILFSWLNELVTDDDKENQYAEQRLTVIIEQHLRVLRYII